MKKSTASKFRGLIRKQHGEIVEVKRKHVSKVNKSIEDLAKPLSRKIGDWSNDGSFNPLKRSEVRSWAISVSSIAGREVRNSIVSGGREAAALAPIHIDRISKFATDEFGADLIELGDEKFDIDEERSDDLERSFIGSSRSGALSYAMRLVAAITMASKIADFASSIYSNSSDPSDIADAVMSPIGSRAEMFVRTEIGSEYSRTMSDLLSGVDLQKRWATIDSGCEKICHPADGQIQDMNDRFEMGNGDLVDYPPAHPNCDCIWTPWKDDWGNTPSVIESAAEAA